MQRLIFLALSTTYFFMQASFCFAATGQSASFMGPLGLNTVPNARMEETGTARLSVSTLDPYLHASLGFQLTPFFHIAVRQSAEASDINGTADRLLPGVDLRLRLQKESAYVPEVTLGMIAAAGHKRMASEYLAVSKRAGDFDLTGGIAWGRMAGAGHIDNPLGFLSSHFDDRREMDGELPNGPEEWFTGQKAAFFGGIEYRTPFDGLALKADWGADRFLPERQAFGFNAPSPWSVGFNYSPFDWLDIGTALVGGDKIYGSLSLKTPVQKWDFKRGSDEPKPLRPYRTGLPMPHEMENAAQKQDIKLYGANMNHRTAWAKLEITPDTPLPMQAGRAARHMANHAGYDVEEILIAPHYAGIEGPAIKLNRRDLETALVHQQGSPEELWHSSELTPPDESNIFRGGGARGEINENLWRLQEPYINTVLDSELSLSEEDSGLLYRTALLVETKRMFWRSFVTAGTLRVNFKDNLHRLHDYRPSVLLPVRSDVDEFAEDTFGVDRQYFGWIKTLRPDLHITLNGGYLEEMYAGAGAEVLYRPFGKTFAIGAQAYQVFKRDPKTELNLGFNGDHVLTTHLNGWYEFPQADLTLNASVGRYLAGDTGGTVSLKRRFKNGAAIKAFVTTTNSADFDLFGGTTHIYSGLELSVPFGRLFTRAASAEIRVRAAQLGRESGQALDTPIKLYDITEPLSYRHISEYWGSILD